MSSFVSEPEDDVVVDGSLLAPFDDELDTTLVDVMLNLKISDRLRTLTRCVDGLGKFRRV